jgi:hypothetical protein
MTFQRFLSFSLLFLLAWFANNGQAQTITISGKVFHSEDPTFSLLVVNKNTSKGFFGEKDGTFTLEAQKTDTILVGALGFETVKICMGDSADQEEYFVKLYLSRKQIKLDAVSIFPEREMEDIQKEIKDLGYDERDYMLSGIDAVNSPITFLYQQFSKYERQKRRAYEIINEDRKRALLKELFAKYVDFEIISLQEDQFEDFVDYMDVPDFLLKNMSQYDFIMYTKKKYEIFKTMPPKLRQDIDTHD